MNVFEAEVTEVLPKVAGVRVRFRDLVPSGFGMNDYVLVLNSRMSDKGGASLWLPEVGEHGLVVKLSGGICVWLGSLPYLDKNQVDPTPNIAYFRHPSGVTAQARDNGDLEILHPSGFRVTVSASGGAMPTLQKTSQADSHGGASPMLMISHPGGASASIDQGGNVKVEGQNVEVDGTAIKLKAPIITLEGIVNCLGVLYVQAGFACGEIGGGGTDWIPGDLRLLGSVYAKTDGFFGPSLKSFILHTHYTSGNAGQTLKPT
jgi:phage baseplate assembly protein gpV